MLLLGVGAIGVQAYVGSRNVSLNPYKPVWLLRYEASQHGTGASAAALDELIARLHAGSLGQSAVDLLVIEGMQLQANPNAAWEPRWGEIVEFAREQGMVVDADWQAYIKTAVAMAMSLEVRSRVMIGDPIYRWVRDSRARLSDSSRRWHVKEMSRGFEVDGILDPRTVDVHSSSSGTVSGRHGGGGSGRGIDFNRDLWGDLPPGTYEVQQRIGLEVSEVGTGGWEPKGPPFLVFDHVLTGTFELTDEPTVKAVVADEHRQAVRDALKIESIEFRRSRRSGFDFQIELDHPPVGLAFDVFAVADDGTEVKIGSVSEAANDSTHLSTGHSARGLTWTDPIVRVVFRPSAEQAARTSDVFEYWGEEVVFEDVPIKLPEPESEEAVSP
ncbi:MAG: hypothetical protein AAGK09_07335 [Planctomycetota bacterium]